MRTRGLSPTAILLTTKATQTTLGANRIEFGRQVLVEGVS
jgi:hypothetical protein